MSEDQIMWTPIARLTSVADAEYAVMLLERESIVSRVVKDTDNTQISIEVRDPADIRAAMVILDHLYTDNVYRNGSRQLMVPASQVLSTFPVVMILLAISLIGWLLVTYRFDLVHYFTFQDFRLVGNGEYWRLLTPAFLHFGIFHVVFNSLWIWELGRRIEKLVGSLHFLAIALLSAVAANIAQYQVSGPLLFGGMSGVVYGLLGYIWFRNKLSPHPLLALAPGIIGLMIGWLLICMTGLIDILISGSVANGAHVGGLVTGIILGIWSGWVKPAAR